MDTGVELLVDAHAQVGEGPLWDEEWQVLYWVDILSSLLYIYDPATGENRALDVGRHVGTVVTRASGGLMLAVREGFASFDLETQDLTLIANPEAHITGNRFNDGKCDPAGRFLGGHDGVREPHEPRKPVPPRHRPQRPQDIRRRCDLERHYLESRPHDDVLH